MTCDNPFLNGVPFDARCSIPHDFREHLPVDVNFLNGCCVAALISLAAAYRLMIGSGFDGTSTEFR
jgi:hypothetical protein